MEKLPVVRTYRDLIVWPKAMTLVTEVYQLSKQFPKEELYALTSQMRRSAVSVPSNIAEGYGRNSTHDYVRFLRVAMGSLYELQTQSEIALNLGYLETDVFEVGYERSMEVGRMLGALIRKLEQTTQTDRRSKTRMKP